MSDSINRTLFVRDFLDWLAGRIADLEHRLNDTSKTFHKVELDAMSFDLSMFLESRHLGRRGCVWIRKTFEATRYEVHVDLGGCCAAAETHHLARCYTSKPWPLEGLAYD
jgi:hypothetical protein